MTVKSPTHRGTMPDSQVRTNQSCGIESYMHQVSIIVPLEFRPMMSRKHSAAPAAFQRHHRTEKAGEGKTKIETKNRGRMPPLRLVIEGN